MKNKYVYLLMCIPAVVLFFIFHTLPALRGVFYSFTDYRGFGDYDFVGLKNYARLLTDSRVHHAYLFTFQFAIVSTILVNAISLLIAIGLNSNIWIKSFLRGVYFLPNVLSLLIVGYIFGYIFAYIIPQLGESLGIEGLALNILGRENTAWIGVVFVAVWQSVAFNTLLYLAGLQVIPMELYESAEIDGASVWRKFSHVTFPLLASFVTINMVLAMKNFLLAFDHIVALTGGGPGRATESISLLIYTGGFSEGQFAYQSANSVVYLILIIVISVTQIKLLQKREVDL